MRKTFLDNLPKKYGIGSNKNKLVIDWNNCIGYKIPFIYDDIQGELLIMDIIKEKNYYSIKLLYKNNVGIIRNSNLILAKLRYILNIHSLKYKYQVGDIVQFNNIDKFEILERIRIYSTKSTARGYKYKCKICGDMGERTEQTLTKSDCLVCSGRKILSGYNDLWTTHPEIARLLKCSDIGFDISCRSTSKEVFICPNCMTEKEQIVANVIRQGFSCPKCGDGISYPEKFVFNVLEQLIGIKNFTTQIKFDWSENKKYDFYIESIDTIIETHGMQHYKQTNIGKGLGRKLEEEQVNDRLKEKLARENGISRYIIVDCSQSSMKFMKKNISKSQLCEIFDFSQVNWFICHEYACKNLVKKACDLWNNGLKNTAKISKVLNVSRKTIIDYLKKGKESKMCDYDSKEELSKNLINCGIYKKRKVICLNNNIIFDSIADATRWLGKSSRSIICECCSGKLKTAYKHPETGEPLRWMYYEEYLKTIK